MGWQGSEQHIPADSLQMQWDSLMLPWVVMIRRCSVQQHSPPAAPLSVTSSNRAAAANVCKSSSPLLGPSPYSCSGFRATVTSLCCSTSGATSTAGRCAHGPLSGHSSSSGRWVKGGGGGVV